MGFCVLGGAMCTCSFGMAPSTLMVTPEKKTVSSMPVARSLMVVGSSAQPVSSSKTISVRHMSLKRFLERVFNDSPPHFPIDCQ